MKHVTTLTKYQSQRNTIINWKTNKDLIWTSGIKKRQGTKSNKGH